MNRRRTASQRLRRKSLQPWSLLLSAMLLSALPPARGGAARATMVEQVPEDAGLARARSRCINLMDLISCGDALNRRPNNPQLLVAEADALVQLKRPGEAIGVYRNALTVGASRSVLEPRIAAARALRRALLETCLVKPGTAAEQACEAAWLPGARDEVAVFKRRGALLQSAGASSAALDAYLAAARLAPKDRAVGRAIIALAHTTGRKDAATLAALAAARERLRAAERRSPTPVRAPALPPDTYSNAAEVTRSN
jgi:tetratricopeptide (TPR) repeat protein